jgi:hypothetical protein
MTLKIKRTDKAVLYTHKNVKTRAPLLQGKTALLGPRGQVKKRKQSKHSSARQWRQATGMGGGVEQDRNKRAIEDRLFLVAP